MFYTNTIPKMHLTRLRAAYDHQVNHTPMPSYVDIRVLEKSHHTKNMIHVIRHRSEMTEYLPGVFRKTIVAITITYEGLVALGVAESEIYGESTNAQI